MDLRSIIDPVWSNVSSKLFQDLFAGVRRYISGTTLTITKSSGKNLISLNVSGNTQQAQVLPASIENVGTLITEGDHTGKYAVPVKISGKNLLDVSKRTSMSSMSGITFVGNANGTVRANGICSGWTSYYNLVGNTLTDYGLHLKPGAYTLSGAKNNMIPIYVQTADLSLNKRDIGTGISFDVVEECDVRILLAISVGQSVTDELFSVQLESGYKFTDYEPYHEPITKTIYLDEPLRSGDTLEVVSGELVRKRKKLILDGSENWELYSQNSCGAYVYWIPLSDSITNFRSSVCDLYQNVYMAWATKGAGYYSDHSTVRRKYFCTDCPTLEEWKAELASNPVTLEYELAEPKIIKIDPTQIPTFEGATIIDVDTDVRPVVLNAVYWRED